MPGVLETEVLIVGAGPAGASTALFLARHGVGALMISRYRGVADTPRAHIVYQRTMEAFRDAGVERSCLDAATPGSTIANTFWLRGSMRGEEIARVWCWGNDPARAGDYLTASPCQVVDLPQDRMEPILISEATRLGAHMRFGWELQSFTQDDKGVTAKVVDRLSGAETTVRAKYMVGADGARSRVVEQLGLPLAGKEVRGGMYNVLCEMDLSAFTRFRHASFYNIVMPPSPTFGPVAINRVVRPWNQWLAGLMANPGLEVEPTMEQIEQRVRQSIGDETIPIRILSVAQWAINDICADSFSKGRVYCMGDAVHRHPPANALGSNTCVQDGFNLAWKLALVLQGKASPRLLDSFDEERVPVGKQIVARANKSMAQAMGLMLFTAGSARYDIPEAERVAYIQAPETRAMLREQLDLFKYNGAAHGVEMTRRYRSCAVLGDGTPEPVSSRDPELYYAPSTWPGSVVPHAWLVRREDGPMVSTLDLVGKGRFHIVTGHGGDAWCEAAQAVARKVGVEIGVTAIGAHLDFEDPYADWWNIRGVEDDGCVLVRPDHIVAWRCAVMPAKPVDALDQAMRQILGWSA